MPAIDELRARLFLLRAAEPPAHAVHDYVVAHGPVEAVERIRDGSAPAPVLAEIIRCDPDITYDLHAIDSGLARLVTPTDDDWPSSRLNELGTRGLDIPLALWVRGQTSLAELVRTAVTLTGSRAATSYGAHVAADFSYNLARAAVTVVAGGAYGVDASAHRGALAGDGPTVVVLPCGVEVAYPHGNTSLFDTILSSGGLLVSEYPLTMHPTRERFVVRSRLLAALSTATVVVEAGVRSGALAVARLATELHRQVYAVPGPITSAQSVGILQLLRTGQARAIGSVEHITAVEKRP